MNSTDIHTLAMQILVQQADLSKSLTIPLQVGSAIQMAEAFSKAWGQWEIDHGQANKDFHRESLAPRIRAIYGSQGKINAIKELRNLAGITLKEAKDQVETWAISYSWQLP